MSGLFALLIKVVACHKYNGLMIGTYLLYFSDGYAFECCCVSHSLVLSSAYYLSPVDFGCGHVDA
jgi:hypothetical protein